MSNINTAKLIAEATANLKRADAVRKEPAVIKAAGQFRQDVKIASESGATLLREASAAWKRVA
jgi:hypothetical protein